MLTSINSYLANVSQ